MADGARKATITGAGSPRMYGELAELWPLISPPDHYVEEAAAWRRVIEAKLGPGRHRLLELGVGGGHNLSHLTAHFDAEAVDRSRGMLEHSIRLNPGVAHHVGDMRSVRLGRTFDAVLIHDAASYLLSRDDVRRTCATAVAHLRPGGLFIAAPDQVRENFAPGATLHGPESDGETSVSYVEYAHDPDPSDDLVEIVYVYFIRRKGGLAVETDRHVEGALPTATWVEVMTQAGFDVALVPHPFHADGREAHLFTGILGPPGKLD